MSQDNDDAELLGNKDPKTGKFLPGNKPMGRRAPGTPNKVNKTVKEAMTEAANNLGGKKGAVGVFEKAGEKDIVAFANMLTKHLPLEIQQEINNVGRIGDVNIISVPPCHAYCPDGLLRPSEEAKKLWDEHHARCGVADDTVGLQVEPEVAELIARATKPKGDDPAA